MSVSRNAVAHAPEAEAGSISVDSPRRTRVLAASALVLALGAAGAVRVLGAGSESTDNAQVQARVVGVSCEVAGTVREVLVKEHQRVEAGAVLMQLDTTAIDVRLARARAELASALANEEAAKTRAAVAGKQVAARVDVARGDESAANAKRRAIEAETKQAEAAVLAAQAKVVLARAELARTVKLHGDQSLAAAQLDEAKARAASAEADLSRAQATVAQMQAEQAVADGTGRAARGKVEVTLSGVDVKVAEAESKLASARVEEAKAAVALAELDRERATVRAPFAGVVERRRVEPGTFASPGAEHFLLVARDGAWVEANFKEAQIAALAPGQPARIELDAFPRRPLAGHVESIGSATLSRTSLVQVGGAGTGFARTAQRVPVTIVLDEAPEGVSLAPGLNATVTVRVKK